MKTQTVELTQGITVVGTTQEEIILDLLNRLGELETTREQIDKEETEAINALIPKEIRMKISGQKRVFSAKRNKVEKEIKDAQATAKTLTLKHGETVKGEGYQAVFVKGRTSWDNSKVEGYLLANEQDLDNYRSVGNPSISIRRVK